MFETKELASLLAIVTEGSFDAAARQLNITPGALSQRIKQMEERAGHSLLLRTQPARTTEIGTSVLRLAQQFQWLSRETAQQLQALAKDELITLTIAVNHDSHATWFLRALADFVKNQTAQVELKAIDQNLTIRMLSDGTAVAAVTTRAEAVPGCKVWRLGTLRYKAVAAPEFAKQWFPDLFDQTTPIKAPMVCFDRTDTLNHQFARRYVRKKLQGPIHYVPASSEMVQAVRLGFGWAMLPEPLIVGLLQENELVDLAPDAVIDSTLYWQVWSLQSKLLGILTDHVRHHAKAALR